LPAFGGRKVAEPPLGGANKKNRGRVKDRTRGKPKRPSARSTKTFLARVFPGGRKNKLMRKKKRIATKGDENDWGGGGKKKGES